MLPKNEILYGSHVRVGVTVCVCGKCDSGCDGVCDSGCCVVVPETQAGLQHAFAAPTMPLDKAPPPDLMCMCQCVCVCVCVEPAPQDLVCMCWCVDLAVFVLS